MNAPAEIQPPSLLHVLQRSLCGNSTLDEAVVRALGWYPDHDGPRVEIAGPAAAARRWSWRHPDRRLWIGLPRCTQDVGIALDIIPHTHGVAIARARLRSSEPLFGAAIYRALDGEEEIGVGEHASSLALAICIAALRAHAVLHPSHRSSKGES
jgi:hypothetical protein